MADKFVWSGAGGANDGSKWEDAYVSLMRDWGAEAGFTPGTDFVYVRSTHAESTGAALTLTGTTAEGTEDPARILCVTGNDTGTDPGTLTTGATVTTTGTNNLTINEKLYCYGVRFESGNDLQIAQSSTDHQITLEKCVLDVNGGASSDELWLGTTVNRGAYIVFLDVDVDFSSAFQYLQHYGGYFIWDGGTVLSAVNDFINMGPSGAESWGGLTIRNVDMSVNTGDIVASPGSSIGSPKCSIERCKINASATLLNGTIDIPGSTIVFHHCQSGTDGDPSYQMAIYTYQGSVETDTARYRTGGASDGERTNPYSWSLDTAAGSNVIELYEPLESPPIAAWTDGDASTAHTYRIYVASGATLQNDEVWVDLIGPNDAATDSLGLRQTTRPDPLTAPANLTTDAVSTWNGADVGTVQQIDITYTPDKPGPITARIYCAKPSERVSVDPKVYIDP